MKLNTLRNLVGMTLLSSAFMTAQAATMPSQKPASDTGFYVGGGLGMSYGSNVKDQLPKEFRSVVDIDDKAFAWKVLGGYQFDPMFGIEAFYTNFGKFKIKGKGVDAKVEDKLSGYGLAGTVTWPLNQDFSLLGKAGVVRSKASFSLSGLDQDMTKELHVLDSKSYHSTNFMAGAGVQWFVPEMPELALRLEWEFYNKLGKEKSVELLNKGTDVHLFSASVVYSF